ncbi:hypothetical protein AALO_G00149890 [Alosa alosa]|uniref:Transmembrane and coiled-coil domain protein 3 n=1 Tax=Alosa alosa TaxID=278164 RepID=A0AAV6GDS8_9TELE|nr:transmembrane and coiled-coil domain protein 3-like [Alosa alosa]KAG5273303.1 hypothetical protein AALO_G00149890 [Alosa alosa]
MEQADGGYVLSIPVPVMRRGGSDTHLELERSTSSASSSYAELFPDFRRSRASLSGLQQKALKVTEQLKIEQTARDANVAEYLKLVNSADKQQVARIRQVFEKKHQKSTQTIGNLQRKLEQYHRRIKDCEGSGHNTSHSSPSTLRHNTSNASNASNNASPSSAVKDDSPSSKREQHLRDMTSGSGRHPTLDKIRTIGPGVSLSPPFFFSKPREFANLIRNKFGSADNIAHLKTSLDVPSGFQQEGEASRALSSSANMVDKPKVLYERLEDQLNDLTELHQHEMANLKQVLASIEEKVAYQANERARDLTEALESCQTRVFKLELQQQQQQTVQWESGGDARVLLGRCINILLALATVVLVCVSTVAKFTAPMLRSRLHVLGTSLGLLLLAFCWKHWEQLQCAVERLLVPT